jgi:hypothetical protein
MFLRESTKADDLIALFLFQSSILKINKIYFIKKELHYESIENFCIRSLPQSTT